MILADTSAWVEYDRATGSPVDRRLSKLIETAGPIAVTEPVIMEVLAGARDEKQEADLRRLLLRFELLSFDPVTDFEGAVRIYRRCRAQGVTPRGMLDCMIASVTWRRGARLLANDADMDRVARVIEIEMDDASLRAGAIAARGALAGELSMSGDQLRAAAREAELAAERRRPAK